MLRRLGAGGMGSVYLARDPLLKRLVAVKLLSPELSAEPAARARFQREAEAVAALSHPNVVAVYNVGAMGDGTPFFVMQYVNGRSIADRVAAGGAIDQETARRYLGEVASALAAAHKRGIIHRDIKPANILVDDESSRALVSDFGIASVLDAGATTPAETAERAAAPMEFALTKLTQTGMMVGTPAYMSPEQFLAEPLTDKTDVYSLGLLGYEMLTGAGPYEVSSAAELIAAHVDGSPKKLSRALPDVSPDLESLLEACLSKQPAARPPAAEVATRLGVGSGVLLEWPPPGLERLHGQLNRRAWLLAGGSYALALPLAALALFARDSWQRRVIPPAEFAVTIAGLGALLIVIAVLLLTLLLWRAAAAIRSGYGWLTVLEVLADGRRDGGALIAGTREYAALVPTQRGHLRRQRAVSAVMLFFGATMPLLAFAAALPLARSGVGETVALIAGIVLPALLLVSALVLRANESVRLEAARRRVRHARRSDSMIAQVVAAWRASFEAVRLGQRVGEGARGRPLLVGAVALLMGLTGIAAASLGYALSVVGLMGETWFSATIAQSDRMQSRFELARRTVAYRLPPDSSVSVVRAGELLHAVSWLGRDKARPYERLPRIRLTGHQEPESFYTSVCARAERGVRCRRLFPDTGLWLAKAILRAPQGFTPEQREHLRYAASHAGLQVWRELGRARAADYSAAALQLPLPDTVTELEMPIRQFTSVKAVALASLAQAALDLEAGRRASAEEILRATIGVGALLIDDIGWVPNSVGVVAVGYGRAGLAAFYEATNQLDQVRALNTLTTDILSADPGQLVRGRGNVREQVVAIRQAMANDGLARGIRWSRATETLPYEPCSDLRQLVFGPDAGYYESLAAARRALVRLPSDSMLLAVSERALDRPIKWGEFEFGSTWRLARNVAHGVDLLVGGHRIESCVSFAPFILGARGV